MSPRNSSWEHMILDLSADEYQPSAAVMTMRARQIYPTDFTVWGSMPLHVTPAPHQSQLAKVLILHDLVCIHYIQSKPTKHNPTEPIQPTSISSSPLLTRVRTILATAVFSTRPFALCIPTARLPHGGQITHSHRNMLPVRREWNCELARRVGFDVGCGEQVADA